jgi:hypothetical protein
MTFFPAHTSSTNPKYVGYRRDALDRAERRLMSFPVHSFFYLLRYVGLRDRLRCPNCRSVGTFKPHGSVFDTDGDDKRHVRRWMCKWCGYYLGPEGRTTVFCDPEAREWRLPEDTPSRVTPESVMRRSDLPRVWPWRG